MFRGELDPIRESQLYIPCSQRVSFDLFRFLRVDTQNSCWVCVSEGVPDKLDAEH